MCKKIVVSLLSIFMIGALTMVSMNPGYVMAIAGAPGEGTKALDAARDEAVRNLRADLDGLAGEIGSGKTWSYRSEDGAVEIEAFKDQGVIYVGITADAGLLTEVDYTDFSEVLKTAQSYMQPIFTEKNTMGLCGLVLGEAYAQYKNGRKDIAITKEYDGLTVQCSGNTDTGLFKVDLKGTLGVEKCQPGSRIMEMKALRL